MTASPGGRSRITGRIPGRVPGCESRLTCGRGAFEDEPPDPPEPNGKLDAMQVNGPEDAVLDWDAINWPLHEDNVRRLPQPIFKAVQGGDLAKARSLQKMPLRSWSNTLTSVPQVTQRKSGRETDGEGS